MCRFRTSAEDNGGRRHVPLAAGVEDMAVVREHFTRALERMLKGTLK
jgi:hypothetical protein